MRLPPSVRARNGLPAAAGTFSSAIFSCSSQRRKSSNVSTTSSNSGCRVGLQFFGDARADEHDAKVRAEVLRSILQCVSSGDSSR